MDIFEKLIAAGFIDLGFAPWESGRGLQIKNLDKLNDEAPGVYVMHHEKRIQKIGKSSASLRRRLTNYRFFDRENLAGSEVKGDLSSKKQRKAIEGLALPGLSVLALQVELSSAAIPSLGLDVKKASFDPHDLEKKLIILLKAEHPLKFGR
jgi:hypothetical protein